MTFQSPGERRRAQGWFEEPQHSAHRRALLRTGAAKPFGCHGRVHRLQRGEHIRDLLATAVSRDMTDLVERWSAETAQPVLSSRFDPAPRLHRLRMSGELCELRDRDLYFSLAESRGLLARFGVEVAGADLALLHQRSEGWAAALQMVTRRWVTRRVRADASIAAWG